MFIIQCIVYIALKYKNTNTFLILPQKTYCVFFFVNTARIYKRMPARVKLEKNEKKKKL